MIEIKPINCRGNHVQFWIGKEHIGNAEMIDGGYLVQNKRKPVATIQEAAKQMIDSKMNYFQCEKNRYHKLLQRILIGKDTA